MINTEGCLDCGRGFCEFCNSCECCTISIGIRNSTDDNSVLERPDTDADNLSGETSHESDRAYTKTKGRPIKDPGDISDPKSTGRKRAALLYPIIEGNPCEWKALVNCGGGKHPIIGCISGEQKHRHHGPNKDTIENSPGNVHRICHDCHNIWHSQNDKDYDPTILHSPRPATLDELADRATKVTYFASN